jgi:hypothetical protein
MIGSEPRETMPRIQTPASVAAYEGGAMNAPKARECHKEDDSSRQRKERFLAAALFAPVKRNRTNGMFNL